MSQNPNSIISAVTLATLNAIGYISFTEQYLKEPVPDTYYAMVNDWVWQLPLNHPMHRNKQLREI